MPGSASSGFDRVRTDERLAWPDPQRGGVATGILPSEHRDRYRREFRAELYDLDRRQQARYAVGVLVHAPALRGSLVRQPVAVAGGEMIVSKPLMCRLRIKHRWSLVSSPDGQYRFYRCQRCGKEHFPDRSVPEITGGGGGGHG